jgi:hypothetical protein
MVKNKQQNQNWELQVKFDRLSENRVDKIQKLTTITDLMMKLKIIDFQHMDDRYFLKETKK